MRSHHPPQSSAKEALADAERKGFRLAVIGRTCALVAIAFFYLAIYGYPNNVYVAGVILATAASGLIPLRLLAIFFPSCPIADLKATSSVYGSV